MQATGLIQQIRDNPTTFIEGGFDTDLWKKQKEIVCSVRDNQYTTVRSCHASGKSFIAGHIAIWFLHAFPESIVLTTAPTFRQVEDVLWKEIRNAFYKCKADLAGEILTTRYNISPNHFAVGLSTDEPDKFQGYHAKHLLVIIDESSGIPANIFEAIQSVASTGFIRILELGNPTDPTGHFANTFKNQFYNKISISCFDTPNFKNLSTVEALRNSTMEQRAKSVVCPYLITPQWVYERLCEWGDESPVFESRCLGQFPTESIDTLISLNKALQASERIEVEHSDEEVLGVDIARYGSDKTVFAHRKGNRIIELRKFTKEDTMATTGRIAQFKREHANAKIVVDDAGVGGGVVDRLKELKIKVYPINVGSKAKESDKYLNLRAEIYHKLAIRFTEGTIAIPKDDELISELTSLKYQVTSNGLIKIESKDDMKKRGLNSPDCADAVALAFARIKSDCNVMFIKTKGSLYDSRGLTMYFRD